MRGIAEAAVLDIGHSGVEILHRKMALAISHGDRDHSLGVVA